MTTSFDIQQTVEAHASRARRFKLAVAAPYANTLKVLSAGSTRANVVLKSGLQVNLRVVAQASYGAALCYFTGAKAQIRRIAQKLGLKVHEYGVFRGSERIASEDEASVYKSVGLPWIPPELREDRGEIEAARGGRLHRLLLPTPAAA